MSQVRPSVRPKTQEEGKPTGLGDLWYLDELFVTIQGKRFYLWRAVHQDGDTIDILLQTRRDRKAAKRFFRKLLKGQGAAPNRLVTDKLGSYRSAHRELIAAVPHMTGQYENNRSEVSHQPTMQRERQMRRSKVAPSNGRLSNASGAGRMAMACVFSFLLRLSIRCRIGRPDEGVGGSPRIEEGQSWTDATDANDETA